MHNYSYCNPPTHMQASSAGSRGDTDTKAKYEKISMILTVVAIVTQVVGFIIVVGTAVGIATAGARAITSIPTTSSCQTLNSFAPNYCRFG